MTQRYVDFGKTIAKEIVAMTGRWQTQCTQLAYQLYKTSMEWTRVDASFFPRFPTFPIWMKDDVADMVGADLPGVGGAAAHDEGR
ncbi:hypothetical protein ACH5RR_023436 [Cinchona calisaya]|uniref:Uncharacterized protein n=1 Tax=Cinchona calisaya TaxID=153742 RepID=A0ABD2ZC73_9GENT